MASTLQGMMWWSSEGVARTPVLVLAICVATFIILNLGRAFYNVFLHPLREYPGPFLWRMSTLPYFYHTYSGTLSLTVRNLHQTYGPIIRLSPNALSYTDSKVWKDVWSMRNPEFPKDARRVQKAPNGYYSILNAPKDDHARFRRLLAHAFSEKGMRDQEPRIRQYVDLLIDRLGEKAQSRESADLVDWYTMTAFDVIGDLAWGESFNGLQERRLHEWIPAVVGNSQYSLQAGVLNRLGLGMFKPFLVDRAASELRKKNFEFAAAKSEKRAQFQGDTRGDFWDRVLIKSANDNATGEGMVQEEIVNNAAVLVLGGAETSATTLSATTLLLLRYPFVMKKLLREIRSSFQSSDDIDIFSVNRLQYMLAVLDEAMRIFPPVPDTAQRVPPVGGGMICGKWVPEGTTIHAHQLSASHMASNFHRPDEFIPERWLPNAAAEFANDDKAASQPFSVGNRNCIGKNLAYAEMRLILAKVLYNFDLELDQEQDTKHWFDQKSFGVWHKKPLYVKLSHARS